MDSEANSADPFVVQVFWASALLAICSAALAPIPILLYFFGAKLRSFSRYVPQA